MMETPTIMLTQGGEESVQRRTCTTQAFTRLHLHQTSSRSLKSGKIPRVAKQSLSNSKENLKFYEFIKKIKSNKVDESKVASNYLLSLRKEYDKMAKIIKAQSIQIVSMRKDIQLIKDRFRNEEVSQHCSGEKVEELKLQLEKLQHCQEQAKMETKILEQIITRMKQDEIYRKELCKADEEKLRDRKRNMKQKEEELLQWDDAIYKILSQMHRIRSEFKKNSEEREDKLQGYRSQIHEVSQHERNEQERRERTYELLSMESNGVMDAKNIVLRQVLMTNKVLDKLLQGKINQLLNQYQDLQNCYHLIKTETNITQPDLLAKKFFSYESSLEQLTSTIRQYQQKQEQLTHRNKQLKQKENARLIRKLEEERTCLESCEDYRIEREALAEGIMEKELLRKKIRAWFEKMCGMVGVECQSGVGEEQQVRVICQYALREANEVKELKNTNKFQATGIRLKKAVKQFSEEDDRIRRTQAQQVMESIMFENIYLSHERKQVKKNQFQIKTMPLKQSKS